MIHGQVTRQIDPLDVERRLYERLSALVDLKAMSMDFNRGMPVAIQDRIVRQVQQIRETDRAVWQ